MKLALIELEGAIIEPSFAMAVDKCFTHTLANVIGIDESVDSAVQDKGLTESGLFYEIFQRHMSRPPSSGEFGNMRRTYTQTLKQEIGMLKLIPGTDKILGALNAAGWKGGLFANSWKEAADVKLEATDLEFDLISTMGFSSADLLKKEQVIQKTLETAKAAAGGSLEKVVIIGGAFDTEQAAKALKIPFIGMGGSFKSPTVFLTHWTDTNAVIAALNQATT